MNLVERLFAEVTQRCVRRGSHTGVAQLEKATLDYLAQRNRDPKPFLWTALISAKCWPANHHYEGDMGGKGSGRRLSKGSESNPGTRSIHALAVRISFGDPAAPHSCFAIGSVYSVEYVFPVNSMKCPDLFFAPEAKSGQFEGG